MIEFDDIDQLIKKGDPDKLLEYLEIYEDRETNPQLLYYKAYAYAMKREYQQTGEILNQALELDPPAKLEMECLMLLALAHGRSDDLELALQITDRAELLIQEKGDEFENTTITMAEVVLRKGSIYAELGRNDELIKMVNANIEQLDLLEQTDEVKRIKSDLSYGLAMAYHVVGRIDEAIEAMENNIELNKELNRPLSIAYAHMELGGILQGIGRIDEALEHFERQYELFKAHGSDRQLSWAYTDMGNVHLKKGDIKQALEFYELALPIYEKSKESRILANHLVSMSNAYRLQGDLEKSEEFGSKAKNLYEINNNEAYLGNAYLTLASTYASYDQKEKAAEHYQEAIRLFEKHNHIVNLAPAVYEYYKMDLDELDEQKKIEYRNLLEKMQQEQKKPVFETILSLTEAMMLRRSDRVVDRGKAQQLCTRLIEADIVDIIYTFDASVLLLEFLFDEYSQSKNEAVLEEMHTIINKLMNAGLEQNAPEILIKSYFAESKIKRLQERKNEAKILLDKAMNLAIEKGYHGLISQISVELEEIVSDSKIRFESIRSFFRSLIRREKAELEQEDAVILLMISYGGMTLYSKNYGSDIDEILVGGFISAVNSFVKETFNQEGIVDQIQFQDHNIILKPSYKSTIAYIFKGNGSKAIEKVSLFAEKLVGNERLNDAIDTSLAFNTSIEDSLFEQYVSDFF